MAKKKKSRKRQERIYCENDSNRAEVELTNGNEVQHLCSECCKDSLYGMILNNDKLVVINYGEDDNEITKLIIE